MILPSSELLVELLPIESVALHMAIKLYAIIFWLSSKVQTDSNAVHFSLQKDNITGIKRTLYFVSH